MHEPIWMRGRAEEEFYIDLMLVAVCEMLEFNLLECGDEVTTACKEHWSKSEPAHGHCAVFALVVQDIVGGQLLRASLDGLSAYAHMRSHYWNLLLGAGELQKDVQKNFILRHSGRRDQIRLIDIEIDLSASQFRTGDRRLVPEGEIRTREYVLSNPDTERRYKLLKQKLVEKNPEWWEMLRGVV